MEIQFHEIGYGKRFFEHQLPKLTRAIEELADAMKAPAPKAPAPKEEGVATHPLPEECKEALIAIMNCPKKAEAFGDEIAEQIATDSEPPRKVGYYAAKAILEGNIDDLMLAISGYYISTLIEQSAMRCEECEEDE